MRHVHGCNARELIWTLLHLLETLTPSYTCNSAGEAGAMISDGLWRWAFFSKYPVAQKGRKKQKISRLGAAPIGKSVTWRRLSKLLTFLGSPPKRDEAKSKLFIRGGCQPKFTRITLLTTVLLPFCVDKMRPATTRNSTPVTRNTMPATTKYHACLTEYHACHTEYHASHLQSTSVNIQSTYSQHTVNMSRIRNSFKENRNCGPTNIY